MSQDPQADLQAQARDLLGRELSEAEIAAVGIRLPTMLRCLGLIREWSAHHSGATMAPIFRVPSKAAGDD